MINVNQLRRLFPVVLGGRVPFLIIGELFLLFFLLLGMLIEGSPPGNILKYTVILPTMLLIALATADLVSSLRRNGELELTITLANPVLFYAHRFIPVLVVAAVQVVAVLVFLSFIVGPLYAFIGLTVTILPMALTASASLYWNLRLRGAGTVFFATLFTILPAMIWIGKSQLVRQAENAYTHTVFQIAFSCLGSQAGILFGSVCLAALALRRLGKPEKLLEDAHR